MSNVLIYSLHICTVIALPYSFIIFSYALYFYSYIIYFFHALTHTILSSFQISFLSFCPFLCFPRLFFLFSFESIRPLLRSSPSFLLVSSRPIISAFLFPLLLSFRLLFSFLRVIFLLCVWIFLSSVSLSVWVYLFVCQSVSIYS